MADIVYMVNHSAAGEGYADGGRVIVAHSDEQTIQTHFSGFLLQILEDHFGISLAPMHRRHGIAGIAACQAQMVGEQRAQLTKKRPDFSGSRHITDVSKAMEKDMEGLVEIWDRALAETLNLYDAFRKREGEDGWVVCVQIFRRKRKIHRPADS